MPSGPDEGFLEGLYQAMRSRAQGMAPMFQPGADSTELTPDDKFTLWERRAIPLEQEWELWRAKNPDGTPMYTREQIGLMVFRDREKLSKSGGHLEPKEWIAEANHLAREASKRRAAAQMAMTPPEGTVM
jgi:hypothetical protein